MEVLRLPRMVIGKGKIKLLKNLKGNSVLIVTDKIVRGLDFFKKIEKNLTKTGMKVEIFDEVEPDPPDTIIGKGLEIANQAQPNWFIAVGGGSSMDTAKAIQFTYETGVQIRDIDAFGKYSFKKSKLIAIPTTSGTGSEASYAAVITDTTDKKKLACVNPVLTPYMAILDPKITINLPKSITLSTALDALVHSIESLISPLSNEFTRAMSIHAINLIIKNLPALLSNLEDLGLREKVHVAALMGGISMSGAGLGLCHGLGHAIGNIFHKPHGICVGLTLPAVLEFSIEKIKGKIEEVIILLNVCTDTKDVDAFIDFLKQFYNTVGAPLSIKELEIPEEDFKAKIDVLTDLTMKDSMTGLNPRPPIAEDVKKIYEYLFEGKKIDF